MDVLRFPLFAGHMEAAVGNLKLSFPTHLGTILSRETHLNVIDPYRKTNDLGALMSDYWSDRIACVADSRTYILGWLWRKLTAVLHSLSSHMIGTRRQSVCITENES